MRHTLNMGVSVIICLLLRKDLSPSQVVKKKLGFDGRNNCIMGFILLLTSVNCVVVWQFFRGKFWSFWYFEDTELKKDLKLKQEIETKMETKDWYMKSAIELCASLNLFLFSFSFWGMNWNTLMVLSDIRLSTDTMTRSLSMTCGTYGSRLKVR